MSWTSGNIFAENIHENAAIFIVFNRIGFSSFHGNGKLVMQLQLDVPLTGFVWFHLWEWLAFFNQPLFPNCDRTVSVRFLSRIFNERYTLNCECKYSGSFSNRIICCIPVFNLFCHLMMIVDGSKNWISFCTGLVALLLLITIPILKIIQNYRSYYTVRLLSIDQILSLSALASFLLW